MEIKRTLTKIKCDMPGCKNLADFTVNSTDNLKHNFYLCEDCLKKLNKQFSKILTPKSIKNVYQKGGINGTVK